jgi:hypothetical protein
VASPGNQRRSTPEVWLREPENPEPAYGPGEGVVTIPISQAPPALRVAARVMVKVAPTLRRAADVFRRHRGQLELQFERRPYSGRTLAVTSHRRAECSGRPRSGHRRPSTGARASPGDDSGPSSEGDGEPPTARRLLLLNAAGPYVGPAERVLYQRPRPLVRPGERQVTLMRSVAMQDMPFNGRTSRPFVPATPTSSGFCLRCGSSLAKRRVGARTTVTGGAKFVVEAFRCRCGAGRRIRRELS